jgi:hypothetical protein
LQVALRSGCMGNANQNLAEIDTLGYRHLYVSIRRRVWNCSTPDRKFKPL